MFSITRFAIVGLAALALQVSVFAGPATAETTTKVADGVYLFAPGDGYTSMFVVTSEGVVAVEPVNTPHAKGLLAAIGSVTDKPVRYLLHTHNHWDHSRGGQVFRDAGAKILAHKTAYDWMKANPHPDMVLPDEGWNAKRKDITLGDTTIEMHYIGMSHGLGMTVFRVAEQKVAYIADVVTRIYSLNTSVPTLTNCTLSGNFAGVEGGGLFATGSSSSFLLNCIVWGNTGGALGGPGTFTVAYSNIEGGSTGAGNTDTDPLFVDAAGGNLRLSIGSPCIDAADNTAVPLGVTTDLDGNPRFVDDPATADTGIGTPPIVDMGAYEFLPMCGNGVVDPAEECDDGNMESADGCDETCQIEFGACCVGTACDVTTEAGCSVLSGSFFGFNSTCDATDADGDGLRDECDGCPDDSNKIEPGICGCGVDDSADSDGDDVPDCDDLCPGVDDAVFGDCTGTIPTVSVWGLLVLALLLLAGSKVVFRNRSRRDPLP